MKNKPTRKKNILIASRAIYGTDKKSSNMEKFISRKFRNRYVFNIKILEKRLEIASNFIARAKNFMIATRNKNFEKPVKKFAEIIECKYFIGRFLPGTFTNPNTENYYEADLLLVLDPETDKRIIKEASKAGVTIITLSNSHNNISNIDFVIPCNNKTLTSISSILYVLAKRISKLKGIEKNFSLKDFK